MNHMREHGKTMHRKHAERLNATKLYDRRGVIGGVQATLELPAATKFSSVKRAL